MKPVLLDLFCGAGGAGFGYSQAGFEVVGVDHSPQKNYPFEFIQADALEYLREKGSMYHAIHASPPCQAYTSLRALYPEKPYPDLIPAVRDMLKFSMAPWVIENVMGAPLHWPVMLCGSMFGLRVRRHRIFELSDPLNMRVPECNHVRGEQPVGVYGHTGGEEKRHGARGMKRYPLAVWREAMGIDWMTSKELSQAIPPAYTHWIGSQLIEIATGVRS